MLVAADCALARPNTQATEHTDIVCFLISRSRCLTRRSRKCETQPPCCARPASSFGGSKEVIEHPLGHRFALLLRRVLIGAEVDSTVDAGVGDIVLDAEQIVVKLASDEEGAALSDGHRHRGLRPGSPPYPRREPCQLAAPNGPPESRPGRDADCVPPWVQV